ncbi:MAG: MerR family transcriptional regulator [Burkholderiaceae bacterium]|jgi:methanogenic corrinoid protein MtbC1|nr:MerR family transcriptional regulator [Burkholderiaceae bacterium]
MNEDQSDAAPCYSIAAVERDTGLSKDTLRVWERRYGFPQPVRDAAGDRSYPAEQVERLRTICRLMDAGHRPGRIVALAPDALQALLPLAPPPAPMDAVRMAGDGTALEPYLALVGRHDVQGLRGQLGQALLRMGLEAFVVRLVAPLTTAVGEAWMQGRFQVFEEHLYTECLTGVLRQAIAGVPPPAGGAAPRVLLTTFVQEAHGLGLLMAEALLALEGCQCLSLGPQTPVAEIARAAQAAQADIVALSFSASMAGPLAQAGLRELRGLLPAGVALWAGGQAPFLQTRALPGVLALPTLEAVHHQVARWRHQTMATSRAT